MRLSLLSLALLASVACAQPGLDPQMADQYTLPSGMISGVSGCVSWACEQLDANDKLIWLRCLSSDVCSTPVSACFTLAYESQDMGSGQWFGSVRSRRGCTGPIYDYGSLRYVFFAFAGEQRKTIDEICGSDLSRCRLSVTVEVDRL